MPTSIVEVCANNPSLVPPGITVTHQRGGLRHRMKAIKYIHKYVYKVVMIVATLAGGERI